MRFVSTETILKELEGKAKDCDERIKIANDPEKRELEEESKKYRQLIALAKSNTVLW